MASLMKQYSSLIVAAKLANCKKLKPGQPGFVYYESHHIWPVAFGRDDRKQNKVLLTFAEHVLAHVLLAKLHPKNFGLGQTPNWMLSIRGVSVPIEIAIEAREQAARVSSAAMSARLISLSLLGLHPQQKLANRIATATRARSQCLAQLTQGTHTFQSIAHAKDSSRRAKELIQCPNCCLWGGRNGMQRTHFGNCKLVKDAGAFCNLSESSNWLPCLDCSQYFKGTAALKRHKTWKHKLQPK